MATTLVFDARAAGQVEAIYATPDIAATRIAAFRAAEPRRGENAMDIGCGPAYFLRDLALAVGPAGQARGVDVSQAMLNLARLRCDGLTNVSLEKADALDLPGNDGEWDLACALQVYAYVADLDRALAELRRVLRPGGRAVIVDTDFSGVVWQSRERERMRRVLAAYDAHVAWPDLPRVLPHRLRTAGLTLIRCEAVPIVTLNYHPNTYVCGLARFIHQFVTERGHVPREEADAWLAEFERLEQEGAFMFALNRFLFVAIR